MATVFWKYGPYINPKPLNPKGPKPLSHPTAAISKVSGAFLGNQCWLLPPDRLRDAVLLWSSS